MQGALKGPAGSVRALALHPTQPLIASVGLDRFLRMHSTETRAQLGRVYLKQQLTGVVWVPPVLVQQQAGIEADAGEPCLGDGLFWHGLKVFLQLGAQAAEGRGVGAASGGEQQSGSRGMMQVSVNSC